MNKIDAISNPVREAPLLLQVLSFSQAVKQVSPCTPQIEVPPGVLTFMFHDSGITYQILLSDSFAVMITTFHINVIKTIVLIS